MSLHWLSPKYRLKNNEIQDLKIKQDLQGEALTTLISPEGLMSLTGIGKKILDPILQPSLAPKG